MTRLAADVSVWEDMDGATEVEKRLNSLLTESMVLSGEVPADECLDETRHLLGLWEWSPEDFRTSAASYLQGQFGIPELQERYPDRHARFVRNTERVAAEAEEIIRGRRTGPEGESDGAGPVREGAGA